MLEANEEEASKILARMLMTAEGQEAMEGDEASVLNDIMGSIIELERGERASVSQIISTRKTNMNADPALERVGLAVFEGEDQHIGNSWMFGDYLFVAHRTVSRHLLRNTDWNSQNIDQILGRISGAFKVKRRIAGSRPWGIMIPMSFVTESDKK